MFLLWRVSFRYFTKILLGQLLISNLAATSHLICRLLAPSFFSILLSSRLILHEHCERLLRLILRALPLSIQSFCYLHMMCCNSRLLKHSIFSYIIKPRLLLMQLLLFLMFTSRHRMKSPHFKFTFLRCLLRILLMNQFNYFLNLLINCMLLLNRRTWLNKVKSCL